MSRRSGSYTAPAFRDRVVQHAPVSVIEPLFEKEFVKEALACIAGRGTHAATRHTPRCCRAAKRTWGAYYALKCGISGFFPGVNRDVLKKIPRRSISDPHVLSLFAVIIDSCDADGRGIPTGSLTSRLAANMYLDPLDHFIKEERRVAYYARYMDDFVILRRDKAYLKELWTDIETFVRYNLDLNLNSKTSIFPDRHGIDFCGYRIWPTHVKPRKTTVKWDKRRLKKMARMYESNPAMLKRAHDSLHSFLGYIKHCLGNKTTKSLLESAVFRSGHGNVKKWTYKTGAAIPLPKKGYVVI